MSAGGRAHWGKDGVSQVESLIRAGTGFSALVTGAGAFDKIIGRVKTMHD